MWRIYTCVHGSLYNLIPLNRVLGSERVYLPLYRVTDTPFHIQGDVISLVLPSDHVVLYIRLADQLHYPANIIH